MQSIIVAPMESWVREEIKSSSVMIGRLSTIACCPQLMTGAQYASLIIPWTSNWIVALILGFTVAPWREELIQMQCEAIAAIDVISGLKDSDLIQLLHSLNSEFRSSTALASFFFFECTETVLTSTTNFNSLVWISTDWEFTSPTETKYTRQTTHSLSYQVHRYAH